MDFEFDPEKSASNRDKHGIDFVEAQALWRDPFSFEFPTRDDLELRYMAIGRIGEKHWSAIFVVRDTRIRLISVRRSRSQEVKAYESQRTR